MCTMKNSYKEMHGKNLCGIWYGQQTNKQSDEVK